MSGNGRRWLPGNDFRLLENGEAFFPRVLEAIAQARREVVIETFILFEDAVGRRLHAALVDAARRGVQVDLTIDGWGSPDLSDQFVRTLAAAGARLHVFDPGPRPFGWRPKALRRLHRKIVVVDGRLAFVGGINFAVDQLTAYGPEAKQDWAVEVRGPLVAVIHRFTHAALAEGQRHQRLRGWWRRRRQLRQPPQALPEAGTAQALFVTRDNVRHPDDIERLYRIAIRAARRRVVIANAYFFPGYRLVRELRNAARRGVDVRLILQGQPDMPFARTAASTLYGHLLQAGVRIFEYRERPLHGKVALADEEWATVGSSNLDPLSLALNLEANVMIRDRAFNADLHAQLDRLMREQCAEVDPAGLGPVRGLALVRSYLAFHVMRKFARWARWLPRHAPQLKAAVDGRLTPPLPARGPR
ncbi:cardiolipin synthase ClsB [Ramlibacter sp. MAHUQ-53]|uniref:cardiolipin synthase ClsB n=1 Tax=unclassified Ramlibacter TaxID=2617605 RepID=UPI00363DDA8C